VTRSFSGGVKFTPAKDLLELTGSASLTVADTVTKTWTDTQGGATSKTYSTSCSGTLYQWRVHSTRMNGVTTPMVDVTFDTFNTVCVPSTAPFGESAPKCPAFYCANPGSTGDNAGCSCCNSDDWTDNPAAANVCPTTAQPTTAQPTPGGSCNCKSIRPDVPDSWCAQVHCDIKYSDYCSSSCPTPTTPTTARPAPTTAGPTHNGSCCKSIRPDVPDSWCAQVNCDPKYSDYCSSCCAE
jgi:hypothetical protein